MQKPLRFDFSSLSFSGTPEEATEIPRISCAPVLYDNAERMAREIDVRKNYFALVSGSFIFGDFLEALCDVHDLRPSALYVSTLGMGEENVDSLVNIMDYLGAERVELIVSHYFASVERNRLMPYLRREFANRQVRVAVLASHAKMALLRSKKSSFVILGSANLSSSSNVEQFTILHGKNLLDDIQRRLDRIMDRFTVFRGEDGEMDLTGIAKSRSAEAFRTISED